MAAFHGHAELTDWALKWGVHPGRRWCQAVLHADVSKCPIHSTMEVGQLLILKAFANCSALCLGRANAAGQTPLTAGLRTA